MNAPEYPLTAAGPGELVRWVAPVLQHYLTDAKLLKVAET